MGIGETLEKITVNRERFLSDFAALAKIGMTDEGLNREAGSGAFLEARGFLESLMRSCGLAVRVDAAGNLFGVLEGDSMKERKILSGSHLDSVTNGGPYDGPLGILAALEAVRSLREAGYENAHSLEVAAFNAEEGGPLGGTFGSRVFCGILSRDDVSQEDLARCGMDMDSLQKARADVENYDASVEVHIEQGPVLWSGNIDIGVPTGIVGISRYSVDISGTPNHAGTTPMPERRDAMQTAAEILSRWFGWAGNREDFVCNVGTFALSPGHISIVPGGARFVLELRSLEMDAMRAAAEKFREIACSGWPCEVSLCLMGEKPPVQLDDGVRAAVVSACEDMGYSYKTMPSGASHDSSPLARVMPAGMIFVPSVAGISHAKEEFTSDEDMLRGVECLANTLVKLDR